MTVPPSRKGRQRIYPAMATIYMDQETDAAVRAYADANCMKRAAALRELLEYGIESIRRGGPYA